LKAREFAKGPEESPCPTYHMHRSSQLCNRVLSRSYALWSDKQVLTVSVYGKVVKVARDFFGQSGYRGQSESSGLAMMLLRCGENGERDNECPGHLQLSLLRAGETRVSSRLNGNLGAQ
jgi:hypothetical protein